MGAVTEPRVCDDDNDDDKNDDGFNVKWQSIYNHWITTSDTVCDNIRTSVFSALEVLDDYCAI